MVCCTNMAAEIRSLSSGTISTLLREEWFRQMRRWLTSRYSETMRLQVNPLQSADYWILDRVQFAWSRFAELHDTENWECWQDCWHAYIKAIEKVRFKCSYMNWVYTMVDGVEYEEICRASKYSQSIYNGTFAEWKESTYDKIGMMHRHYGMCDGPMDDRIAVLYPFRTPCWMEIADAKAEWNNGKYRFVVHADWPAPRIGLSICGEPCSYESDAKFDVSADRWEEWRTIALA